VASNGQTPIVHDGWSAVFAAEDVFVTEHDGSAARRERVVVSSLSAWFPNASRRFSPNSRR
jgi:hypothetical protein